jgi:hypothetical protein
MEEKPKRNTTIDTVEQLLRRRPKLSSGEHHVEIEQLAEVISGLADEGTRQDVDEHLASCPDCRETLTTLQWAESEIRLSDAKKSKKRQTNITELWPRIAAVAAAAVIVAALSFFFFSKTESFPDHSQLSVKGGGDQLIVAVQRDDDIFRASRLEKLIEGDRLGIFYTTVNPGYMALLNRDGHGNTAVLFPFRGKTNAPVQKGEKVSLENEAVVEKGSGCEWLVGIFSDAPIPLATIKSAVANGTAIPEECDLNVRLDAARSVVVLPFRR